MDRKDAHDKVNIWIDEILKHGVISKWHYGKHELHRDIDRMYNCFESKILKLEKLIEEKDKQIESLLKHSDFDN